MFVKNIASS